MSNVSSAEKREQAVALRCLGWPLRRIQQTTGVCRETASGYLKVPGVAAQHRRSGMALRSVSTIFELCTGCGGREFMNP